MKKSDLKKALRREAQSIVPDVSDRALSLANIVAVENPQTKERTFRFTAYIGAVASFATVFVIAVVLLLLGNQVKVPAYATVLVKVNPAFEMMVKDDEVTAVRALNQEAVIVLSQNQTAVGLTPEQASLLLVELSEKNNYEAANGVTLYVAGKDERVLRDKILSALSINYTVNPANSNIDIRREADNLGITEGKMEIIREVQKINPALTSEQLAEMDTEDLLEILEDYDEDIVTGFEQQLNSDFLLKKAEWERLAIEQMNKYRTGLEELKEEIKTLTPEQINAKVEQFNTAYLNLGNDFMLEAEDDLSEEITDLLNEISEVTNGQEDIEDFFDDWYETFVENFKTNAKVEVELNDDDEDENDDDEDEDDDENDDDDDESDDTDD